MASLDLKSLLDNALVEGCSGDGNEPDTIKTDNDKCKTQLNLTALHKLLIGLIDGQNTLKLAVSDQDQRISTLEGSVEDNSNKIADLLHWTQRGKGSQRSTPRGITPRDSITSENNEVLNKQPLPPLSRPTSATTNDGVKPPTPRSSVSRRRSSLALQLKPTSSMQLAQMSIMNFADKNDFDKLSTRINLLQTKLDKLTNIIPSNEQLMSSMMEKFAEQHQQSQANELKETKSDTSVQDAYSKLVLTKRIESNEESLEKFMQLIDELSGKIREMKSTLSKQLEEALSSNANGEQIDSALASIQAVFERLEKIEGGMSKLDSVRKKLAELSSSHGELKDTSHEKFKEFTSGIKNLSDMIAALEKQLRALGQQVVGVQQQAAAALAACSKDAPPVAAVPIQVAEPVPPMPDLETIRALGELTDRVGSLDEKILGLENAQNVGQNELDLMKASILEEIPTYIENALQTIRSQLAALNEQNEKLNEIIDIKLKREEKPSSAAPSPPVSRPRSASSRLDLEKMATKAHVDQIQNTLQNSTNELDTRISAEIVNLHDKIKQSSTNLWDELANLKQQYGNFGQDLGNLRSHVIAKLNEFENSAGGAGPPQTAESLGNITTLSPALTNLIDRLQKKQYNLEQNLENVTGSLAQLDEDGRLRSGEIAVLRSKIDELDARKADRSELANIEQQMANKSDLNMKVSRDDFDGAIQDMSNQLNGLISKMLEVEENWKSSLDQTNAKLQNTMKSDDMNQFKAGLEQRLKSLKTLLEQQNREEHYEHGDHTDNAAVFRRPLLGYKCISCDKVTMPVPGCPVASIPMSGNLPHMNTIRPYTTFDLHTIRSQSKITKTGYEERIWLKMKNNLDKSYRQHVAESLNHAFNAYEQGGNDTVPIGGGSSIPKGYQITKAGRSCGGGHTLTNPHVRFTHLKHLGELWDGDDGSGVKVTAPAANQQPEIQHATEEISQQFEESRREMQLVGNDGHVYRGRLQQADTKS